MNENLLLYNRFSNVYNANKSGLITVNDDDIHKIAGHVFWLTRKQQEK